RTRTLAKLDRYMMTMYKGKRRNHRCKFAAPFHGSGVASVSKLRGFAST
ncbi:unnamed protein product, partial [Tetraodon nigroviridis]